VRPLIALPILTLLLTGCGYRMGGSEALYPDNVETVSVPAVTNETFARADTARLTSALVTQLERRTPYRVAPVARADTVLEVTITDVRRRLTSRDPGSSLPNEQLYVVLADVVWKDLRTGQVLFRLENLEQTATMYPTLGESDFFASQEAAEQLAIGIVEAMGHDW
jgi:hypothetical protein